MGVAGAVGAGGAAAAASAAASAATLRFLVVLETGGLHRPTTLGSPRSSMSYARVNETSGFQDMFAKTHTS